MWTRRLAKAAAALSLMAGTASAHPLKMEYCIKALGGGQYEYTFKFILDNHDNSWVAGQGWGWLTFGAAPAMSSPLTAFVGDPSSLPIGPFTEYSSSGGGVNGPTLGPVVQGPPNYPPNLWIPNNVGDFLTWRGTSTGLLPPPTMQYNTLMSGNGAAPVNFDTAVQVACQGEVNGACCRPDGTCVEVSSASCTNDGGIYNGNGTQCSNTNCPQPPTGACCLDSGCAILTQAQCLSFAGTYNGNNTTCATANCAPATAYREFGDVGELPGTAGVANNGSGTLSTIHGRLHQFTDADMYKIQVCDPANFSALVGGFSFGAEAFLFKADGTGVTNRMQFNGQAQLTNQFTSSLPAGEYYLAVAAFLKMPQDATGQYLWITDHFDNIERAPDGPGAANPIDHWDQGGGVDGTYTVTLTGACFVGGAPPVACYPNCDHSTIQPCLNVQDFSCFLNAFANSTTYANCDNSTIPPVLNVQDFSCFLNKFANGCSSC